MLKHKFYKLHKRLTKSWCGNGNQPLLEAAARSAKKELKKREENTKQLSTIHAHHILRTVLLHPVLRLQSETFSILNKGAG